MIKKSTEWLNSSFEERYGDDILREFLTNFRLTKKQIIRFNKFLKSENITIDEFFYDDWQIAGDFLDLNQLGYNDEGLQFLRPKG